MQKPIDFDEVQGYGERQPLPPGGYICRIMKVEETTAKSSGAEMLKISLDIAEGEYKDYYAKGYRSDTRPDKKWGCSVYQLTYDPVNPRSTNKGFKTFTTAVCKSNQGFVIPWGDKFGEGFKNKIVGVIFRREQYIGTDGNTHFSTKAFQFRSTNTIREGVPVPEDKLLDSQPAQQTNNNPPVQNNGVVDLSDFEEISVGADLPF